MDDKKNLLIIDDEIEILNTLKRIFYKEYNVHITQNTKDAFEIMKKVNIGVILCDQQMPKMKGTDFFIIVKDMYPSTIRILFTGYSDLSDAIKSINEGQIFRYLTKPWNLYELKSSVKEAFDKNALICENKIMIETLKNTNVILKDKVRARTAELEVKNIELEKISNDKSRILGIVAHDLRSPIGGIFSLSKFIKTSVKEVNTQEPIRFEKLKETIEFIEIITDSSKYLLDLINDIIDVSVIETGKLELNLESIMYIPFLNKSIAINRQSAKNKKIKILVKIETEQNIVVCMDKIKIGQVINNFLQNAIKFSYPLGNIILKVCDDGNYVTTKVIDEGEGIPKSQRNKLFKIFSKTSSIPTAGEKSNGLGLYISQRIIEAHNGIIGFEENIEKGSTFYFKLIKEPIKK
ncbi:hybrid sensor histidine kinase/response regulator [Clostridium sp.]|uniref:hybrid sensor histidine kinase/response regulator n=1 Tax=Clostridium sp. TaxID=1506 RepID=UPI00260A8C7A|nr:hybrid sensor histidine kinase/response regulator [uncultured Clostridium sp.]